jgi:AraC family transcriptional regulator, melibiose operon regulatory protein
VESFGLRVWRGAVERMTDPHQHTEIELNLIEHGGMTYRFGARATQVHVGEWLLFWGALPHVLTDLEPGTQCIWVTLPLASFLRFALPERLSRSVLHGEPVRGLETGDAALFQRWARDWLQPHADTSRILELELEARLRRLARDLETQARASRTQGDANPDRAAQLAQFITEHHLEPLTIPDIANAVGLNPNYAAGLFKRSFGMTMLEYLTQHRVAHAQRLLAMTERGVLDIALESGFGSSSRFYVAFERATGRAPLEYRRGVRG